VANKNKKTMEKQIILTPNAPAPIGPYSQAVKVGKTLYASGQIAINPATGEMNMADIPTETRQVMENLKAVLTAANTTFNHVVMTTIFLSDMAHFGAVNEVYGSYFTGDFPARATVAVKTLPRNVNVEIAVIAAL
jgi:2-iminobutanoate/2-iminopropanoate deaminase